MKIIQFRCPLPETTLGLRQEIIDTINRWSRFQWLANRPGYQTRPFSYALWRTHTIQPDLSWANVDEIYPHLGDTGREEWNERFGDGDGPPQGVLRMAPVIQALPDFKIEIVDVADPVAAGYLPEPKELET